MGWLQLHSWAVSYCYTGTGRPIPDCETRLSPGRITGLMPHADFPAGLEQACFEHRINIRKGNDGLPFFLSVHHCFV